ncbi:hypothetical protein [Streptomyces sp. NPDC051218]|uniref:mycothiol-dependent nitroreductase Rv2466c family protein n=1 Tax=Streptomyces sp. NPDC051218 TaxID=3365645 RepID=UPI00379B1213
MAARHGSEALGAYFDALGVRLHERGEWDGAERALADAGLPAGLAAVAWTQEFDDAVRASHEQGIELVGTDVGTPVLSVQGVGAVSARSSRPHRRGQRRDGCGTGWS